MTSLLKLIATHFIVFLLSVCGAGGLIYGLLVSEHSKKLREEADKTAAALVAVEAAKRGGVEGQLVEQIKANEKQAEFIKELQKIDSRVRAVEQSKTEIKIEDKPIGHTETAPGSTAPTEWVEDRHRFGLNLKTFDFWRKQSFSVDGVVVSGPAGQRIEKVAFHEFDPVTGEEIPLTGVAVKTAFQFVRESGPAISPWHIRLAVLGGTMGLGAGVQVNPWRGLLLTVGGAYKKSDPRGLFGIGWRLRFPFFDSTLGISGFLTIGKGGLRGDVGGSDEITR